MKRDMDLIRLILLDAETIPFGEIRWPPLAYSEEAIDYHISLCIDAGFLVGKKATRNVGGILSSIEVPSRLTWQGFEFLDMMRDENRWISVKRVLLETTGGFVAEVAKSLAISWIKQSISIP